MGQIALVWHQSPCQASQPDTSWSCKTSVTGPSFCRYLFILLGDTQVTEAQCGTVWSTCLALLPDSDPARNQTPWPTDVDIQSDALHQTLHHQSSLCATDVKKRISTKTFRLALVTVARTLYPMYGSRPILPKSTDLVQCKLELYLCQVVLQQTWPIQY